MFLPLNIFKIKLINVVKILIYYVYKYRINLFIRMKYCISLFLKHNFQDSIDNYKKMFLHLLYLIIFFLIIFIDVMFWIE